MGCHMRKEIHLLCLSENYLAYRLHPRISQQQMTFQPHPRNSTMSADLKPRTFPKYHIDTKEKFTYYRKIGTCTDAKCFECRAQFRSGEEQWGPQYKYSKALTISEAEVSGFIYLPSSLPKPSALKRNSINDLKCRVFLVRYFTKYSL